MDDRPPSPPGIDPELDARLWELLARADRVLGRPRPEREELPSLKQGVRETERKVPVVTGAIAAAVRTFEATADLVEAHFRRLRAAPAPEGRAATKASYGPSARLAAIEGKIRRLERTLIRLRRGVKEASDEADEWERRAMFAVERGDDTTARDALRHRRQYASEALALARDADAGFAVLAEMREAAAEIRALHEGAAGPPEKPG